MQPETTSSDFSEVSRGSSNIRICPECKRETKRIQIDVQEPDWLGLFFCGPLAAMFPHREQAQVCEHCGNIFERRQEEGKTANRVIGFILFYFSLAIAIGVLVLIIGGMIR